MLIQGRCENSSNYSASAAILIEGFPDSNQTPIAKCRDIQIPLRTRCGGIQLHLGINSIRSGIKSLCKNSDVIAILIIRLPDYSEATIRKSSDVGVLLNGNDLGINLEFTGNRGQTIVK